MPLYTYRCSNCGSVFDYQQRMADATLNECIICQSETIRRVVNNVGVVFKGSGFYINDHRNTTQQKNKAAGESKNEKEGEKAPAGESTPTTPTSESSSPAPTTSTPATPS